MNAISNVIAAATTRMLGGLNVTRRMRAAALCGMCAVAATAAQAAPVTFSAGELVGGTLLTLSSGNVSGGLLSSTSTTGLIAVPTGTVGLTLSGQPTATGGPATLTFGGGGVSALSFLWGSPDERNTLVVTDINLVSFDYTETSLAALLPVFAGNYITLTSSTPIRSLRFISGDMPAFEASNFRVLNASAVPEPGTLALAGLALLASVAALSKRRARG